MLEDFYCGNSDTVWFSLKLLYVVGLHPVEKFKLAKCLHLINLSLITLIISLGIVDIVNVYHLGFTTMSDSLQSTMLMMQLLLTSIFIYYHQDTFYQILIETKYFINLEEFDQNDEVYLDCRRVFRIARNCVRSYFILCVIIALGFDLDPLISGKLPFAGYYPNEQWKSYLIVIHEYATFLTYAHLMGFDTSLVCISSEIIVQFKLLNARIMNLNGNNCKRSPQEFQKQLKLIVDHHNFLVEYIKKICIITSELSLIQFLVTLISGCVHLFIVLEEGFPIEDKIKTFVFLIGRLWTFGFYCGCSEIISSTASQLADTIFYSDWYNNDNVDYVKSILMIIQRSQMDFIFTGGSGLIRMNLATFTLVFKSCLSFYTSIKAIEREKYLK